jgi:2-phosphoglycerate kinase
MLETIVVHRTHGLPYSKGLMAQSLSASGLAPERAYRVARVVAVRLEQRGMTIIDVAALRELVANVLREEESAQAARRFLDWQRLDRLERPLIVLLTGAPGVGKSTLASLLGNRLGITRVIATDAIRQVIRAFFAEDRLPAVHFSSFEAGITVDQVDAGGTDPDIVGFTRQAETVRTGVEAIVARAIQEQQGMIVEGVHLEPGTLPEEIRSACIPVHAVVTVSNEAVHRGHFAMRGAARPASRYLDRFEQIRKLQDHLVGLAVAAGVPVIDNLQVDRALARVMDLVLAAVATAAPVGERG